MATELNQTFYIKQGDLLPVLRGTFVSPVPPYTPQAIFGAPLRIHIRNPVTGETLVDADATNLDDGTEPLRGRWEYAWQDGDTDDAGDMEGEVQATFAGKPLTAPNTRNFTVSIFPEIL